MNYLIVIFLAVASIGTFTYGIWSYFNEDELTPWRIGIGVLSLAVSITLTSLVVLTFVGRSDRFSSDWLLMVVFFGGASLNSGLLFFGLIAYLSDHLRWLLANLPVFGAITISGWLALQLYPIFVELRRVVWLPVWLQGLLPIVLFFGAFIGFFRFSLYLRRPVKERIVRWRSLIRDTPYFLLLRSFDNRFNLDAPKGMSMSERGGIVSVAGISIIPRLIKAVSGPAVVVAIGRFEFGHAADAADAIQINTSDEAWRRVFELFAQHAKGIIMIPSDTEGVIEEFVALRDNETLWNKTAIFIPPELATEFLGGSASNTGELDSGWPKVVNELNSRGIRIPDYDERGMFYVPRTGRIERIADTDIFRLGRAIGAAFEKIVADLIGEYQSFGKVYREHRRCRHTTNIQDR